MSTKSIAFALLFTGCAWTNNNRRPAPVAPVTAEQQQAEQARTQAVFQAILGSLSRASAARARPVYVAPAPSPDPVHLVCRPRGPYSDEVVCDER